MISFDTIEKMKNTLITYHIYDLDCDCTTCQEIAHAFRVLEAMVEQKSILLPMDDRYFDTLGAPKE